MLEQSLQDMIVLHPDVNLELQDYIPEFVNDLIASASEHNQSPEMVGVAHSLIENDSPPEQCTMIIDVMKDYLRARTSSQNSNYSETRAVGRGIPSRWGWKFKIEMGKIWAQVLKTIGQDEVDDDVTNGVVGVRG